MSGGGISKLARNRYGDEGAFMMARHFPELSYLANEMNDLGSEGAAVVGNNLTGLHILSINDNNGIRQGTRCLGRLPTLCLLDVRTYDPIQRTTVWLAGL